MKKFYFLLSIFIICILLVGCNKTEIDSNRNSKNENYEFSFRNIPLGTRYTEAKKQLEIGLKTEGYKFDNVKERVLERTITLDSYEYIIVAGHQATVSAVFCMPDRSVIQKKNIKQTILQSGIYCFYPISEWPEEQEQIYSDIRDKLIELYGYQIENGFDVSKMCQWKSITGQSTITIRKNSDLTVSLLYELNVKDPKETNGL